MFHCNNSNNHPDGRSASNYLPAAARCSLQCIIIMRVACLWLCHSGSGKPARHKTKEQRPVPCLGNPVDTQTARICVPCSQKQGALVLRVAHKQRSHIKEQPTPKPRSTISARCHCIRGSQCAMAVHFNGRGSAVEFFLARPHPRECPVAAAFLSTADATKIT